MKKRNLFIFVCVLTSLIGVIGYTYSKWSVGFAQNEVNVLNVSCFDTTLTENSYINLENTYIINILFAFANAFYFKLQKSKCIKYS